MEGGSKEVRKNFSSKVGKTPFLFIEDLEKRDDIGKWVNIFHRRRIFCIVGNRTGQKGKSSVRRTESRIIAMYKGGDFSRLEGGLFVKIRN